MVHLDEQQAVGAGLLQVRSILQSLGVSEIWIGMRPNGMCRQSDSCSEGQRLV